MMAARVTPERSLPGMIARRLLGHRESLRLGAVADHQEPAGEALLDRVEPVAGGALGDLSEERLGVAQE